MQNRKHGQGRAGQTDRQVTPLARACLGPGSVSCTRTRHHLEQLPVKVGSRYAWWCPRRTAAVGGVLAGGAHFGLAASCSVGARRIGRIDRHIPRRERRHLPCPRQMGSTQDAESSTSGNWRCDSPAVNYVRLRARQTDRRAPPLARACPGPGPASCARTLVAARALQLLAVVAVWM